MYLVDTSIWIDYIKGVELPHTSRLDKLLENPLAIGINEHIYMEILQGAKNQKDFDKFVRFFSGQRFYSLLQKEKSYAFAAHIYQKCRRKGLTIRSSIDCLIAQCAIENEVILLHNDRDFKMISSVVGSFSEESFLKI